MNILARYTWKNLWLNKKRTGVTILGVILSSALVCGVILLGAGMQKMMIDQEISTTGNYHAMFQNMPFEKVKYVAQNSAVKTAMLKVTRLGAIEGKQNPAKPYLYLTAYDQNAMDNLPVNLTAGRLPENSGEILISQLMVDEMGGTFQLGDHIQISFGNRTSQNGTKLNPYTATEPGEIFAPTQARSYTIVGFIKATFEENISAYPGYAGITTLETSSLAPGDLVDVGILVRNPYRVYSAVPEIASSAGLINLSQDKDQTDRVSLFYNDDLLQWMGVKSDSRFTVFFVGVLGFMIVLVVVGSGLVIYNAFSLSVNERKKQFGMFASTGATSRQIHRTVMFEALLIGFIGIPLGIGAGIIGVGITLSYAQDIIGKLIGVEQGMQLIVSPLIIVLTVLFSAATIFFSALVPARRAAKVSPIDAIRLSEETDISSKTNPRISSLTRHFFGFEGQMALKSIWRDRKRFRTTILSLMISIILFVAFNSMMEYSSVSARMNNQSTNFDLSVLLSGSEDEIDRFVDQAINLPQVQAYSYQRCMQGQALIPEEKITHQAAQALTETGQLYLDAGNAAFMAEVCAYGPLEFEHYRQSLGLTGQEDSFTGQMDAILVNHNHVRMGKLFEFDLFKAAAGEKIEISFGDPSEAGTPNSMTFTIAVTADTVPLGASLPAGEVMLIVSDAVFDRWSGQVDIQNPTIDMLYFRTDDVTTLTKEVRKVYGTTVGNAFPYYSPYESNQRARMTESMVNLFFYGFLTLITLVGITNMINTVDTNLQLRRREFAMLRSVGLTPPGFRRILYFESLFYSLSALLLGLPIAILLSVTLYTLFMGIGSFGFTLPWKAILICAAGVLLIVYVTMSASGSRISKDNIVETVKGENL